MAITFGRKGRSKNNYIPSSFRTKLENVMGKKLETNQVRRAEIEILESGYVSSTDEISTELLTEYKLYKQYFPRIRFNKSDLEKAKSMIDHLPSNVSAEKIFRLLNDIDRVQDGTIYYWFQRINSRFTTNGEYSKQTCVLVLYAALRRKSTKTPILGE